MPQGTPGGGRNVTKLFNAMEIDQDKMKKIAKTSGHSCNTGQNPFPCLLYKCVLLWLKKTLYKTKSPINNMLYDRIDNGKGNMYISPRYQIHDLLIQETFSCTPNWILRVLKTTHSAYLEMMDWDL